MSDGIFPPGLILILGAFALPFVSDKARQLLIIMLPLLTLWLVQMVPNGVSLGVSFMHFQLELVEGDNLSRLFATIFALMAFVGGLFALNQKSVVEMSSAFAYAGAAIGVAFAGDLITMFIYWELMAVGSSLVIWSAMTESSYKSSMRYILMHLFGGVVLMVGVVAHVVDTGSIEFAAMELGSFGTWMMLIGFLINAGAPPFSSWLPDAYPEASWSGTVFLSAFTTKTAVFVLLKGFPGAEILIWVGLYMIMYGIIYALLENDMRRILAYSIINQVGFMVVGVGIGTEMAINGAASHAFTHIIYKGLLLMSAGSVMYMTGGKRKCSDLGGLFQTMPITAICGIIGALAISSFPWTSGFVSKSMTTQAAADMGLGFTWFWMMAASAGVFLHAGIKFPWFVFFQKDSGLRPKDPPWNMKAAMILFAFLCIALGVYPEPLYAMLPFPTEFVPYTYAHVMEMLQILLFSGLAFFVTLPLMKRTLTLTLDTDWFYRKLGTSIAAKATVVVGRSLGVIARMRKKSVGTIISMVFEHHGPRGALARSTTSGLMVMWVILLLLVYLVIYLFV